MEQRAPGEYSFDELWQGAKSSIFRLELLDKYDVEEERAALQQFRNSGIFMEGSDAALWRERIEATKKRNVKVQRVHIVGIPPSDYLIFEIEGYKRTQKAGEQIFLIPRDEITLPNDAKDFWMFDDQTAVGLEYSSSGEYLSTNYVTANKIASLIEIKNALLSKAIALNEFIIQNEL